MNIGLEIWSLDVNRVGRVDDRIGYVPDDSTGRHTILVVGLDAVIGYSCGFSRNDRSLVDIYDGCGALRSLGCNTGNCGILRVSVCFYDKAVINIRLAAVNADSLVVPL